MRWHILELPDAPPLREGACTGHRAYKSYKPLAYRQRLWELRLQQSKFDGQTAQYAAVGRGCGGCSRLQR